MGTGKQRISLAVRVLVAQAAPVIARVAPGEPAVRAGLVDLAAPVVLAGSVEPAAQVVRVALAELAVQAAPVAQVARVALAEPELATVQAVAELEIAQVEVELAIDLALAELAIVLAEGLELEIGRPLVHLAVLLRTRSVIAVHRRGLVPVLGAEDLVEAVETTPERVAVEAVTAWAAAA
jgi:hypothetical protein